MGLRSLVRFGFADTDWPRMGKFKGECEIPHPYKYRKVTPLQQLEPVMSLGAEGF